MQYTSFFPPEYVKQISRRVFARVYHVCTTCVPRSVLFCSILLLRLHRLVITSLPSTDKVENKVYRYNYCFFYVPCITNITFVSFQRDAPVRSFYFISLQDLSTCFGCSLHPSSGLLKTAYATTGTSHMMWQVSSVMG
jgi:hypothetical protein